MAVWQLSKDYLAFPDPHTGEPDGLLAVGGDLSVDRLVLAYSNGIFPWYGFKEQDEILWFCPMDRFVIFPMKIHVSHSMRSLFNSHRYHVTFDQSFADVIQACSRVDHRNEEVGAWLGSDMITAYCRLHDKGFARSIEVWEGQDLVGGLYGVTLGRCFFGESMFSLRPSASKIALISLARWMGQSGGCLIDCQFETPHLKSMGGEHIDYDSYMALITT